MTNSRSGSIPYERSVSLTESLGRGEQFIKSLGLSSTFEQTSGGISATRCEISHVEGKCVAIGYGKGRGASSSVGSLFEAIEHFLSDNLTSYLPWSRRSSKTLFQDSNSSSRFPYSFIDDFDDQELDCLHYRDVFDRASDFNLPLLLCAPRAADALSSCNSTPLEMALSRYSSNNGFATGIGLLEARVHATLECLERDFISKFMTDIFIGKAPRVQIVNNQSLPKDMSVILSLARESVQRHIEVIDISSIDGLYAFAAVTVSDDEFEECGFGCSLSAQHALSRALHELVQSDVVTKKFARSYFMGRRIDINRNLSRFPRNLQCAKMKISSCARTIPAIDWAHKAHCFEDLASIDRSLHCILSSVGKTAYYSSYCHPETSVSFVHAAISGQRNFFLSTEGALVFPDYEDVFG